MKLIDADKLYDWLYGNGYHEICEEIRLREGAGSFSPTPPVQPDTTTTGYEIFRNAEIDEKVREIAKEKGWIK
jgi:hypothetical protein